MSETVTRIQVGGTAGTEPYEVLVGRQLLGELGGLIGNRAKRVAVIHPEALADTGEALRADLAEQGFEAVAIQVPNAEEAKTAEVAAYCWKALGQSGFTRTDVIVGVGGGATTDLAGFVAATWLRGVRWIAIPTTVLAMVDAAVGGKTGINTAEGKNLVGSFHPPAGVLCDLAALDSLPVNDYVSGLAEIIKAGFIADPVILDLIEADPQAARTPAGPHTSELIERSIRVKAEVVSGDRKESGRREILNTRAKGTMIDPAWSPDRSRIAYGFIPLPGPGVTYGADLYVAAADGSNPRAVFATTSTAGSSAAPPGLPTARRSTSPTPSKPSGRAAPSPITFSRSNASSWRWRATCAS